MQTHTLTSINTKSCVLRTLLTAKPTSTLPVTFDNQSLTLADRKCDKRNCSYYVCTASDCTNRHSFNLYQFRLIIPRWLTFSSFAASSQPLPPLCLQFVVAFQCVSFHTFESMMVPEKHQVPFYLDLVRYISFIECSTVLFSFFAS